MASKGAKVTLRGFADDAPEAETGDVVYHIRVQRHPVFQRLHQHLLIDKDIPLIGALTGVSFGVRHLDGRVVYITSAPGEVIQPGAIKCIPGAGMPIAANHFRFGDLLVRFNIIFPPSGSFLRSPAEVAALEKLVPGDMDAAALSAARSERAKRNAEEEEEDG